MNEQDIKDLQEIRKTLGCSEGQSLLDRARHYANPEKFVDVNKVIACAVKMEKGIGILLGSQTRIDYEIALTRINHKVYQTLNFMDMEMVKKSREEKQIITPGGN